jgi:acetyltransferase-like isoleucine patch superfamily enzyme
MIRTFISKVRNQEPGIYGFVYRAAKRVRRARVPHIRPLGSALLYGRDAFRVIWGELKNVVHEQMLRSRCQVGADVQLHGDMPDIWGDGEVVIGTQVTISNRNTWIVGLKVYPNARLEIGDNTVLGYLNLISVAKSVRIGNHCLFAGEVRILDNNSHSLDFEQRRLGMPLQPSDVAPVIIEDDVWVGMSCTILKGVTIGRGAVVAAGAVVTRSVPPFTVVGGNPARIVKHIEPYFSLYAGSGAAIDVHAHSS